MDFKNTNNLKKNMFLTPDRTNEKSIKINNNLISTFSPNINDNRFIPNRDTPNSKNLFKIKEVFDVSPFDISEFNEKEQNNLIYQNLLTQKLLNFDDFSDNHSINSSQPNSLNNNFLQFSNYKNNGNFSENLFFKNNNNLRNNNLINSIKKLRERSKIPYKILDAPEVQDDYYSNIIDWSEKNILSICLKNSLYLWNKENEDDYTGGVTKLDELIDENFSVVKYNPCGEKLIAGTEDGKLLIYDTKKLEILQNIKLNYKKISCLSFYDNNFLSIGGKDNFIRNFDLRTNKIVSTYLNHTNQITGLKWNKTNSLLASGSDDNNINIWDFRKNNYLYCFKEHKGSVRALEWSLINRGFLLSGGGNQDFKIKFWNTNTGNKEREIETDSQVCNLIFSKNTEEFISTHGYYKNKIIIWDYNTLEKNCILEGHQERVLFSCLSPDGENLATTSADETLKFWNCFPKNVNSKIHFKNDSLINIR